MFVAGDFMVDLSFPAAQARLAKAAGRGSLGPASAGAYGDGLADLTQPGHAGTAPGMPELAEVRRRELVAHGGSAVLTLRWEAHVPGGELFPALDADITLIPAGGNATRISLAGVYRPPPAWPSAGSDRGIWHRVAAATIRFFLARLSAALADTDTGADTDDGVPCEEPGDRSWPGAWPCPEILSLVPLVPGEQAAWGGRTPQS
jgi:hypothetical protein